MDKLVNFYILSSIMLITGVLGGIISYLFNDKFYHENNGIGKGPNKAKALSDDINEYQSENQSEASSYNINNNKDSNKDNKHSSKSKDLNIRSCILISIVSVFLTPLILKTISNDTFEKCCKDHNIYDYYIFSGYCLVIAISAKKFINLITIRFTKELANIRKDVQDVQEKQNETEEAVNYVKVKQNKTEKKLESEIKDIKVIKYEPQSIDLNRIDSELILKFSKLNKHQYYLLKIIYESTFTYRLIEKICLQYNELEPSEIKVELESLEDLDFIEQITKDMGTYWKITDTGRAAYEYLLKNPIK